MRILKTTLVRYEAWCVNSIRKLNFKSVFATKYANFLFSFNFKLTGEESSNYM